MGSESEVAAGGAEATAGDIDPLPLRPDGRPNKAEHERAGDGERPGKQPVENEGEAGQDFQPREIKGEAHADRPGQEVIIADVVRKLERVAHFQGAGVNKNRPGHDGENAPNDQPGALPRGRRGQGFCHASQPPSSTWTFSNPASLRNRSATAWLALQLSALQ